MGMMIDLQRDDSVSEFGRCQPVTPLVAPHLLCFACACLWLSISMACLVAKATVLFVFCMSLLITAISHCVAATGLLCSHARGTLSSRVVFDVNDPTFSRHWVCAWVCVSLCG